MLPRSLAVRVLTRVLSDHEPLDEVLAAVSGEVNPEHRGWLQDVCAGTLRWRGRLDWIVDSTALKKKPTGWLRKVLLIATYQILVQERTPAPAVVSETVSEVRRKEGEAPAKFANAVLRKIAEHSQEWRDWKWNPAAPLKEQAAWASLPDWLWSKLVEQHGIDWSVGFAQAVLERPKLWLAAASPEGIASGAKPGPVPGSWESTQAGSVQDREGFSEGRFIVQDISSQFLIWKVTEAVLKAVRPESLQALDLCAAPGGKAVGLSWKGFTVIASDQNERRLRLLRETAQRAAPGIRVVPQQELPAEGSQDLVWVDAPCSGTGIIRRHPDVRWLRRETELPGLIETQNSVLKEGWARVRPGGFLAYSVCSVLSDEGIGAIRRAGLESSIVQEWDLAPHRQPGGDGFWGVLLRKEEGAI